ncbi:MAG: GNAT family N-acetyltransferase [Candidatus Abyssobacteria bacterium SURF_5]|uniref:GNAT family N-acetyltransferase n=1 Tax=Abyssobacteria bacterium (strain SURF_5) TaxID=2093360 RepID=A0A3A4PBY4_ABYX5|nr:MAG: GNAT family N-acetyltransferase [Candidatus Abyssubacteria bacterium SURF_5]
MITIRPLKGEDKDQIVRILRERRVFPEHEMKVAIEVLDDALRFPERGDYQTFCAVGEQGDLAGYICFGLIPITDAAYDLYWIAVSTHYGRQGVGGALVKHMEHLARSQGARQIYIETSSLPAFEQARTFYKKNQYELVSILTDFYKAGDHKLIFMKNLEPKHPYPARKSVLMPALPRTKDDVSHSKNP